MGRSSEGTAAAGVEEEAAPTSRNASPSTTSVLSLGAAPIDKCGGAWVMFLIMGVGLLFPWNAILQATDFFLHQFPCTAIEFDLSVAYMCSVLLTMLVAIFIMHCCSSVTAVARVTVGFVLMLASLLTYAAAGDTIAYMPAVMTTVMSGVGDGLAQTGLYGMSSTLPPKYTTATMIGSGVSGLVVTVLRIVTKQAFDPGFAGLMQATDMYFYIAASFLVFCIVCVVTIECVPIVRFYRRLEKVRGSVAHDSTDEADDIEASVRAALEIKAATEASVDVAADAAPDSEALAADNMRNETPARGKSVGLMPMQRASVPLLHGDDAEPGYSSSEIRDVRRRARTAPVQQAQKRRAPSQSKALDIANRARAFSQRGVSLGVGSRSILASLKPKKRKRRKSTDGRDEERGGCLFCKVLRLMRHHAAIVLSTYLLTLAVYPGEVLLIQPTNETEFLQEVRPAVIVVLHGGVQGGCFCVAAPRYGTRVRHADN